MAPRKQCGIDVTIVGTFLFIWLEKNCRNMARTKFLAACLFYFRSTFPSKIKKGKLVET